jgi:hypothetical protein
VLDWATDETASVTWQIPNPLADLTEHTWLSFRACQGTRHAHTVALDAPLDFSVTLVDAAETESTIRFGEFGAITSPYKRTGLGGGAGWANEFNTIRLRLVDFQNDGSTLDLTDIKAIRFDFGPDLSSPQGRIGIDDLMLEY